MQRLWPYNLEKRVVSLRTSAVTPSAVSDRLGTLESMRGAVRTILDDLGWELRSMLPPTSTGPGNPDEST
eukprot:9341425-Pyramimonas_sp.AAC.1